MITNFLGCDIVRQVVLVMLVSIALTPMTVAGDSNGA